MTNELQELMERKREIEQQIKQLTYLDELRRKSGMTELQKLMEQKKQIEQQIKVLMNQISVFGKAKVGVERYPTDKPDRWYVAVEATYKDGNRCDSMGRTAWRSIVNGASKQDVIDAIPEIIRDLQGLYEKEKG